MAATYFTGFDPSIIGACDLTSLFGMGSGAPGSRLGTKKDHLLWDGLFGCVIIIVAATYFTGFDPSIIGGSGLNFSVRDGKR